MSYLSSRFSFPRLVMPSCPLSARVPIMLCFPIIVIRLDSPTLLAHRAAFLGRPAQPTRRTGRGTRRERLLDGFVLYDFIRCYMIGVLVIYSAFLLYIGHSCYISRIFVICPAFLLYIERSCYMRGILVICPAFLLSNRFRR